MGSRYPSLLMALSVAIGLQTLCSPFKSVTRWRPAKRRPVQSARKPRFFKHSTGRTLARRATIALKYNQWEEDPTTERPFLSLCSRTCIDSPRRAKFSEGTSFPATTQSEVKARREAISIDGLRINAFPYTKQKEMSSSSSSLGISNRKKKCNWHQRFQVDAHPADETYENMNESISLETEVGRRDGRKL